MNEKVIYTQTLKRKDNVLVRTGAFAFLIICLIVVLFIASRLPYSGIVTLLAIFLFSFLTLKLLNGLVFDITYVLYEDRLVFVRQYGRLKWENEVFYLNEDKFFEDKIIQGKTTYDFHPDEELRRLILK